MGSFAIGCIVGYFVNKYDQEVLATIKRWWASFEELVGISKKDSGGQ